MKIAHDFSFSLFSFISRVLNGLLLTALSDVDEVREKEEKNVALILTVLRHVAS
jgi:hypothetical protein